MCDYKVCGVHGRNDVREDVTNDWGGSAITYVGDYAVVTMDNPNYHTPEAMIGALLGAELPEMFLSIVYKVGPEKAAGDLTGTELDESVAHHETFLSVTDERLIPFMDPSKQAEFNEFLTEVLHDRHDELVLAVESGMIS